MFKHINITKSCISKLSRYYSPSSKDYYRILGITKDATKLQIKKAFTQKVKEYHPDKNSAPDAKDKFTDVSEAYETLSDENKRKVYDTYSLGADEAKSYGHGFGHSDFSGFQSHNYGFDFNDMFDDFENIFGYQTSRKRNKRAERGSDIVINIELDFMDAINGIKKEISYKILDICESCKGNKTKSGTSACKCNICHGKGNVSYRHGPMIIQMMCEKCEGQGTVIKHPCNTCKGTGMSSKHKKEEIRIPSGINDGKYIKMSGKGNRGVNGGPRGDIIIKIKVIADSYFRREGYDIYGDVPITISQSVLGDTVEIKTVNGSLAVNIPPGTNHGDRLRLPNEGVRKFDSTQYGDHFCIFRVHVPKQLTEEQRAVFEQLKKLENNDISYDDSCSKDKNHKNTRNANRSINYKRKPVNRF